MNAIDMKGRLDLFPLSTTIEGEADRATLHVAGCSLEALAEQYGTPLYSYDRLTLDQSVFTYAQAAAYHYPGQAGLTYAGKAFLCTAIAQWTQLHGLWLDCTGAGELRVAAEAGVPRPNILVHGVNKSPADLEAAVEQAGTLVVDNLDELERLSKLYDRSRPFPDLWLRLRPGTAVDTHVYTQTGQTDSKFGLSLAEIHQSVQTCLRLGLPLTGLHFHQGSHFHDPAPLGPAIDLALELVADLHRTTGWVPQTLSPGGGWGVAYHESELPHPPVEPYVQVIASHIVEGCERHGLPLPRLQLEPGRSLVARAGVALYRVGTVKQSAHRRWLLLDGGLADNPRPALYRSRYSALPVRQPGSGPAKQALPVGEAWLAGPYCESSDVLIEALPMPEVDAGDLVAVPVSGAYQLSMGSNYNGARKPAVLLLENGRARLIQRRETLDDLVGRDLRLDEPLL